MYEDLNDIVRLKFGREREAIGVQVRQDIQEAANRFAVSAGAAIRSGQHEATLARMRVAGAEHMARALLRIWVDFITHRNGHIARADATFVADKVEQFVRAQTTNLNRVFSEHASSPQ